MRKTLKGLGYAVTTATAASALICLAAGPASAAPAGWTPTKCSNGTLGKTFCLEMNSSPGYVYELAATNQLGDGQGQYYIFWGPNGWNSSSSNAHDRVDNGKHWDSVYVNSRTNPGELWCATAYTDRSRSVRLTSLCLTQ